MNETELDALDRLILNRAHQKQLGYARPSDEWMVTDELGTAVLPDFMQDRCHRLVEAGFLPEFAEFV